MEFLERFTSALHGTLGSYHRDAMQRGYAYAVARLPTLHA
jgi:hypothetical protein